MMTIPRDVTVIFGTLSKKQNPETYGTSRNTTYLRRRNTERSSIYHMALIPCILA
jgi:hypothetical protein